MDDARTERVGSAEGKAGLGDGVGHDRVRHVFANRGAMLEPVTGSASRNPHVVVIRMAIDQEIAARRVLVLTHPALDEGSVDESWQAPGEPGARLVNAVAID